MSAGMHNFTHNQIAAVISSTDGGPAREGLTQLGDLELFSNYTWQRISR